jgi:hypothetical protein
MAKSETLTYDCTSIDLAKFVGEVGGPSWPASVVITSGAVTITPASDYSSSIISTNTYDLTSSYFETQIVALSTGAGTECYIEARVDSNNNAYYILNQGNWVAGVKNAGVDTSNFGAYSAVSHKYLRIRESGGTIFFDGSADAITWSNLYSHSYSWSATAVTLRIRGGYFSGTPTGTFQVDNINLNNSFIGTKTQSAISRVANTKTKTQTSISRIAKTVTKTQTAVSRVANNKTKTQTAISRIAKTVTKTQTAISRVANSKTKTQTAISRVANSKTKTQSATANIQSSSIVTKTQTAIARVAKTVTKTQSAIARVSNIRTKTQTAVSRVANTATKTQTAVASIGMSESKTQSAVSRIVKTLTKTQSAIASVGITSSKTQSARSRVSNNLFKEQTATAHIKQTQYLFITPTTDGPLRGTDRFWRNFRPQKVGVSVLKTDGVYRNKSYPSQTEIMAAEIAYVGGHEHYVSASEASDLVAAGYTVEVIT